ncbi:hypothetical protein CKA34_15170 [Rhizobium sp. 11515TR]|nr:hypothetical protein CKA34_15170 [Rhizobium sp. 11515TR]
MNAETSPPIEAVTGAMGFQGLMVAKAGLSASDPTDRQLWRHRRKRLLFWRFGSGSLQLLHAILRKP